MLLSDGHATDIPYTLYWTYAVSSNIRVITVGLGPDVNEFLLYKLASNPDHENSIMTHGESLWVFTQKLAGMICPGEVAPYRAGISAEVMTLISLSHYEC